MPRARNAVLGKGSLISLVIDSVAFGGQGVGRYRDMAVFVPLTVDGDECTVTILDVKKRYAQGMLTTLLKPSVHRMEPRCPSYGLCGGCQLQHIAYAHQLVLKRQQVYDAFSRIGQCSHIPLSDALPSPSPWHYRQKADFHVRTEPNGHTAVGFNRPGSHDILDIERCEIIDAGVHASLMRLRETVQRGKDRRAVLWSEDPMEREDKDYTVRNVKGRKFLVPRQGFFQANRFLAETLVDLVLEMSGLTGSETVVDGYCGSGFFSAFLAPAARMFYGIEFSGPAVNAAEKNLKAAGIGHGRFYEGDVGAVLEEVFVRGGQGIDVLVFDPPRTGLDRTALAAAIRLQPDRIVYVSCNPATMARDVRVLVQNGFSLEALQPLDMFPQTSHIEAVGLLRTVKTR